jgi:hypothetical protein
MTATFVILPTTLLQRPAPFTVSPSLTIFHHPFAGRLTSTALVTVLRFADVLVRSEYSEVTPSWVR